MLKKFSSFIKQSRPAFQLETSASPNFLSAMLIILHGNWDKRNPSIIPPSPQLSLFSTLTVPVTQPQLAPRSYAYVYIICNRQDTVVKHAWKWSGLKWPGKSLKRNENASKVELFELF